MGASQDGERHDAIAFRMHLHGFQHGAKKDGSFRFTATGPRMLQNGQALLETPAALCQSQKAAREIKRRAW